MRSFKSLAVWAWWHYVKQGMAMSLPTLLLMVVGPFLLLGMVGYGYLHKPEVIFAKLYMYSFLLAIALLGFIVTPIFVYAKLNRKTLSPPADHVMAKTPDNMMSWIFIGLGLWKAIEWYFGT
jgi:hypothetical protein